MGKTQQYDEIDIAKIGKALWRRIWLILLTAVVIGAFAFSVSAFFIMPTYEAETLMYVNNASVSVGGASVSISSDQLAAAQRLADTYMVILKSSRTLDAVIDDTGINYSAKQLKRMISAAPVNNTEIFTVRVRSANRQEAERIANSIARILPDKISDVVDGGSVRIVDYAITPTEKASPNITKNTFVGFMAGLFAACVCIVIFTLLDTGIHDEEYLTQTYNLPVLASIPNLFRADEKSKRYKPYDPYGRYGTKESGKDGGQK